MIVLLAVVSGALNPAVTQATIGQTICQAGWAAKVRPPKAVTEPLKRKLAGKQKLGAFELDHAIPIELGGALFDPNNLWLERHAGKWGSLKKDRLENKLRSLVCKGTITLDQARAEVWPGWIASYKLRIGK